MFLRQKRGYQLFTILPRGRRAHRSRGAARADSGTTGMHPYVTTRPILRSRQLAKDSVHLVKRESTHGLRAHVPHRAERQSNSGKGFFV